MRPDINAYYSGDNAPTPTHPPMRTPHLDALASRSLLFKRAYVQYSMGSPSRNSFWTSRRPDSLNCYDETCYWRRDVADFMTLPQYFKMQGYVSLGFGKLFQEGEAASGDSDPPSWSEPLYWPPTDYGFYRNQFYSPTMMVYSGTEEKQPLPDRLTVDHAIEAIRRLAPEAKNGNKPFFLGVGLIKPSHPFQYPEDMEDHYNIEDIPIPLNKYAPSGMPDIAWHEAYIKDTYETTRQLQLSSRFNTSFPDDLIREMRVGYYKSISFCDAMVGRITAELKSQSLDDSTIIVFVGDHGYHMGEQGMWIDQSNFEVALRAPMIIRAPGLTDRGSSTAGIVEFVDLFPTIVDLAGLPQVPLCTEEGSKILLCTEGVSLLPLFYKPQSKVKDVAFSQYRPPSDIMGYTIRTHNHRYTEWVKYVNNTPQWDSVVGVELYDHIYDKNEMLNRQDDANYAQTKQELSELLRKGWREVNSNADMKADIIRQRREKKRKKAEEAKAKAEREARARELAKQEETRKQKQAKELTSLKSESRNINIYFNTNDDVHEGKIWRKHKNNPQPIYMQTFLSLTAILIVASMLKKLGIVERFFNWRRLRHRCIVRKDYNHLL